LGRSRSDGFVEIFHGLNEVGLTDDDVGIGRDFHANRLHLNHGCSPLVQEA
jgi:hypothetical protein